MLCLLVKEESKGVQKFGFKEVSLAAVIGTESRAWDVETWGLVFLVVRRWGTTTESRKWCSQH